MSDATVPRLPPQSFEGLALHLDDAGAGEPVVLLHSSGMSGAQWRRNAEALVRGGARVERFAGAGHMGPLTHLEQFDRILAAHLAAASTHDERSGS